MKRRKLTSRYGNTVTTEGNNNTGKKNILICKRNSTENYMLPLEHKNNMKTKRTTSQEWVFFENNQKTKNRKKLDSNNIYLDRCSTYNKLMEEKYATKIHQPKSALYGEWNTGVSNLGHLDQPIRNHQHTIHTKAREVRLSDNLQQ